MDRVSESSETPVTKLYLTETQERHLIKNHTFRSFEFRKFMYSVRRKKKVWGQFVTCE